jgi:hypothetical protein
MICQKCLTLNRLNVFEHNKISNGLYRCRVRICDCACGQAPVFAVDLDANRCVDSLREYKVGLKIGGF